MTNILHETPLLRLEDETQQDRKKICFNTITNENMDYDDDDDEKIATDCSISYIRALTAPPVHPTLIGNLKNELLLPWNLRIPIVDASDPTTNYLRGTQSSSKLFHEMLDCSKESSQIVKLQPYFSILRVCLKSKKAIWKEVALSLRELLFRRVGMRQKADEYVALTACGQHIFLATGPDYIEAEIWGMVLNRTYYLLRCHFDSTHRQLIFGYHTIGTSQGGKDTRKTFHHIMCLPINEDIHWRLKTTKILANLARIMNCFIDYAIPLTCQPEKRFIDENYKIRKVYKTDTISGIPSVTVQTMMDAYKKLAANQVPHTDQLLNVTTKTEVGGLCKKQQVCTFGPIGRSYPPKNINELMDAMICVGDALVAIHGIGLMHRDIRWANVARSLNEDGSFSNEWFLFDFELATPSSPKPLSFGNYTLATVNHAPEMFLCNNRAHHTTAVDIWGLGFLIDTANVDVPKSHATDLMQLKHDCMLEDDSQRPTAAEFLNIMRQLKSRPCSSEKDVVYVK